MPQKSIKESNSFRKELISLLTEENAHPGCDAAAKDLRAELRGDPPGLSHSAYQLVEHLRIAQWDIVEYTLNPNHKSPNFPDGYWLKSPEPPHAKAWDKSIPPSVLTAESWSPPWKNPICSPHPTRQQPITCLQNHPAP